MATKEEVRINHNYLALRGVDVDDVELQEEYPQIPDDALYTPRINDIMLDITYKLNLEAGVSEEDATMKKKEAERNKNPIPNLIKVLGSIFFFANHNHNKPINGLKTITKKVLELLFTIFGSIVNPSKLLFKLSLAKSDNEPPLCS